MTFLPIVNRELRAAARRRRTYWIRVGAAAAAFVVCLWILTTGLRWQTPDQLGKWLFGALTTLAFGFGLLAGLWNTADCLSREKREGTLGLLFLTDLKGYDVVSGKLIASSLNAFYGMMAVFPVLAISLLFGGVTAGEFGRMTLVLSNTLFCSLATGMFVSALSRREGPAAGWTFLLVAFLAGGFPAIGAFITEHNGGSNINLLFLLPSLGYAFNCAFDSAYAGKAELFWSSLAVTHVIGWLLLQLSSLAVPRVWQDKAATIGTVRWRERWQLWRQGNPMERRAFRTRLFEKNPVFWLAGRDRLKPYYVWSFLGLAASAWLWAYSKTGKDMFDPAACMFTAFCLHTILKIWVVSDAVRCFAEQRQTNALELLLSTPLTVKEILRGQMMSLKRQFAGPMVAVLIVDGVFLKFISAEVRSDDGLIIFFLGMMVMFVADAYTLAWVGMWQGLTTKHSSRASLKTVSWVLVLPWVIVIGILLMGSHTGGIHSVIALFLVTGAVTDFLCFVSAFDRLQNQFRRVATGEPPPSPVLSDAYPEIKIEPGEF